MDFQPNNPYTNSGYPRTLSRPSGDGLATAAMILGILSVVTAMSLTVYLSMMFGSIGIVLALLSKGRAPKLISKARIGITCAVVGILFTGSYIITTTKCAYDNPELLEQALDNFEEQYGISYEELINTMLDGGELPTN
ncbi:MAG: hypothetical protein K2J99_01745 [Lachnospiraceae bacterium]|nr:hypothetical protein [Lachnospiraceae bacterium]